MDASPIKAVADWMKTADLAEVVYRKDGTGFSLTALGAGDPATINAPAMPAGRFVAVASDGVGVFQWNEPGKARKTDDGVMIIAGDVIGVHDIGEILLGQRQGNLAAQRHAGRREVIEGFLIRADHAVKMNIASVKLHAGRRFSGLAASSGLGGRLGGCR